MPEFFLQDSRVRESLKSLWPSELDHFRHAMAWAGMQSAALGSCSGWIGKSRGGGSEREFFRPNEANSQSFGGFSGSHR